MPLSRVLAPTSPMTPKGPSAAHVTAEYEKSPEVSRTCSFCTLPSTNCLPSPADPGTWEGASTLARFGLDIGGTLCKVVYFEPFTANPLDAPARGNAIGASNKSPIMAPGRYFISTQESTNVREEEQDSDDKKIENKNGSFQNEDKLSMSEKNDFLSDINASSLERDDRKKLAQGRVKPYKLHNAADMHGYEINVNGGRVCLCKASSTYTSDGTISEPTKVKLDKWTSEVGSREQHYPQSEDSSIQIRKLWMPSHYPVYLPGCGTLYFKCFETWRMEEFLFLTKKHSLLTGDRALGATGGGARKFRNRFLEIAGLQLERADEIKSLVQGIDFLVKHAQYECYKYAVGFYKGGIIQRPLKSAGDSSEDDSDIEISEDGNSLSSKLTEPGGISEDKDEKVVKDAKMCGSIFQTESAWCLHDNKPLYPYLVVNIGSGVSILRVDSPDQFQRVGGTSIGGSTFLGLSAALTGCNSFEEAIKLAAEGDSTEIDMLVGDIYGGDYTEMGLAATTVASSFGKLVQPNKKAAATQTPQHLAKAALLMVTNNVGSLAMLHARATAVDHVMFTGSFLHGNKLAMRLLTVAMEFWSKGQIKAIFLRHEGHAGAVGALLSALNHSDEVDALLLK